jgi:hypothetical protein
MVGSVIFRKRCAMEKVKDVLGLLPHILNMPSDRIWSDYDKEADVLYLSSGKCFKVTWGKRE